MNNSSKLKKREGITLLNAKTVTTLVLLHFLGPS